jgi:vitamin K-dependent gamma-carboxylase
VFDLFVLPALLWRRSRPFAVAAALMGHLTNANLFSIGIFPWLMIAALPIYFEPQTVRRWLEMLWPWRTPADAKAVDGRPWEQRAGLVLFGLWMTIQCVVPLRHWRYPGEVNWHEQGHNFSWHMKLRNKSGKARFEARDPRTGWRHPPPSPSSPSPRTTDVVRSSHVRGAYSPFLGAPTASTTR